MQHLDIFNRPKGSDNESDGDEDDDVRLVRKNTRLNAATGMALPASEPESEDESDMESKTTNNTSDTDDASTIVDSDTNTDASGGESDFDEIEEMEETPAMIAKKTATAASALANSESAKKKPTKRAVKVKATLADITTLQQSYDDMELNDDSETNDLNGDEDDDEGSDDGMNYLRKFDSEMRENYITEHHHEMMQMNMAEVDAFARVVRNADGEIVDSMHKTMPFLTKYEKTRILGQRAKQLNQGAQPMIPIDKKIIDGYLIAQLELQQKALPFIIRRPLPGGKSEYWRLADLELI
jgi:DNA-directed RNA polymerase I, II, and III subunit RPABC2